MALLYTCVLRDARISNIPCQTDWPVTRNILRTDLQYDQNRYIYLQHQNSIPRNQASQELPIAVDFRGAARRRKVPSPPACDFATLNFHHGRHHYRYTSQDRDLQYLSRTTIHNRTTKPPSTFENNPDPRKNQPTPYNKAHTTNRKCQTRDQPASCAEPAKSTTRKANYGLRHDGSCK